MLSLKNSYPNYWNTGFLDKCNNSRYSLPRKHQEVCAGFPGRCYVVFEISCGLDRQSEINNAYSCRHCLRRWYQPRAVVVIPSEARRRPRHLEVNKAYSLYKSHILVEASKWRTSSCRAPCRHAASSQSHTNYC